MSSKKIGGNLFWLSFIPDSFLHLVILSIFFTGVGIYVLSLFIGFIRSLIAYKELLRIVGTLLMIAGVYFYGSYDTEMSWRAKMEEAQAKIAKAEEKSKKANIKIVTKIVTQTKFVHDQKIVVQEKIIKDAAKIDAECKISPEVIIDLNAAAKNPLGVK